jgi:alkylhydroperoxidase family enzyme
MDYLRYIVDTSPSLFLRFAAVMPLASSRKVLPKDAWYVASIVSVQHEDCGPCLQIVVNLARKDRVAPALIRATIDGNFDELSPELVDVYQFTKTIASGGDDDALRETLRSRYGDRGLIELAYAITGGRIPPTVKRVLGYAKSCSLVNIEVEAAARA